MVEFVIYGRNTMAIDPKERMDKGNQVTVAWSHIPVALLASKAKHKMELKGGNPFKEQEIITAEDTEKPQASKSLLKKIFGGSNEAKKVQRYFMLEAKPFLKLPEQVQVELSSMPTAKMSCLVCKHLLPMAVAFRNHCFQLLTKHEQEMTQPKFDLVMVQFPKIYNSPDFCSAMAACWSALKFIGPPKRSQLGVMEDHDAKLEDFVRQIYAVMCQPNVKLD